jgi:hypothetical protein
MTPAEFLAKLRHAFGQQEPADYDSYNSEHRREAREQTTLNLLSAESGKRGADRQKESRYRKSTLRWTRATFILSLATLGAVGYYAWVAELQRQVMVDALGETKRSNEVTQRAYLYVKSAQIVPVLNPVGSGKNRQGLGIAINFFTNSPTPGMMRGYFLDVGREKPVQRPEDCPKPVLQGYFVQHIVPGKEGVFTMHGSLVDDLLGQLLDGLGAEVLGRFFTLYGTFFYEDVFRKPRKASFCFTLRPHVNREVLGRDIKTRPADFAPCSLCNDWD